ncbi:unnamed protein product [Effrenium voratum]|uniref:Uncharacterized protein n=1 Tax=Effrenium voratum TaxID=2562239 RepID=A0AA36J8B9_9DINO|nr:unnamed protein product [Effrenium voratum]CAJ1401493.1 unnamed protein product [Effrenium voratum]CAJ1420546.1 unnamed protein product [Effrenium voratum]|mmetsp:Transcript_117865/g.279695  ORF Transcript_117865/g.279695 Transcript_117865/m.279695 type:complete len:111 (-) Transcript_117865:179-511(-)
MHLELLDKLAIYVVVVTPLIILSKPVLPKVKWGYDFLPQMALHMWSFLIACLILLHSGEGSVDTKMAIVSFAAAMLIVANLATVGFNLNLAAPCVALGWELIYTVDRFGK